MRLIARLALAAALLTSAVLRADTPATTQWVVTSAKATGGNNQYVTSLRIVNPERRSRARRHHALRRERRLRRQRREPAEGQRPRARELHARDRRRPRDEVRHGRRRRAALRFDGHDAAARVWVLSQTLVVNALSSTGVPGTNGFAIPSQNTEQLVAVNETAYVPYISSSTSALERVQDEPLPPLGERDRPTVVTVSLLKGDGTALGTRDVTLARYAQTQINNIAASFGYSANDTNLTATVKVRSGGPVATGASVIDNAIASISYSPPMKVARANNGAYGLLLNDGGSSSPDGWTSSTETATT